MHAFAWRESKSKAIKSTVCRITSVPPRLLVAKLDFSFSFLVAPVWTSGSPRTLLVLGREFESRPRARFCIYLQKQKQKKDQLLRAPSVGKHNSTRVDEGRAEIFSRKKWVGGKKRLPCDPGSELRLGEIE